MTSTLQPAGKPKRSTVTNNAETSNDGALLALLQSSSLACIVVDKIGKIQSWNSAAESLLGWKEEEVLQTSLLQIFPGGRMEDHLRSTGAVHLDVSLPKKDGEALVVEIWSTALPAGGAVKAGRLLLLQDVMEKKFLERALLEASEREQRRIGQELHDHLCQHLLGAAFAVKGLAGALDHDHSKHAPQLHALARLINDAVAQVRDISRGLHPVEFDAAGLMSALHELANRASHMIKCTFHCNRRVLIKNANTALNAYRIAQASVNAALQETGAKKIEVTLSRSGPSVRLQIGDDGKKEGELTANPAGIAAKTLQYRIEAMRGSLSMNFDPKKGTLLTCTFPS